MSQLVMMLLSLKVDGMSMAFHMLILAPISVFATSQERLEVVLELPLEVRCQVAYQKYTLRASTSSTPYMGSE
jgi:hypothetical protein